MILSFLIIIGTVLLDQATKLLAVKYLQPVGTFPIINEALHLTYHQNKGAAFGILQDHRWVFMIVSTLAIVGLIIYIIKYPPKSKCCSIGLSFIIGGGIGNMIDRTLLGYVVDFIDFRLINFAIFNVADSFVCIGAALVLIYVFFFDDSAKKEEQNDANNKGN